MDTRREVPVRYVAPAAPEPRRQMLGWYARVAAWARANGQDPARVVGSCHVAYSILEVADDPTAVAALAGLLPDGFDRADPVRAAARLCSAVSGLDDAAFDRAAALLESDGPPAA